MNDCKARLCAGLILLHACAATIAAANPLAGPPAAATAAPVARDIDHASAMAEAWTARDAGDWLTALTICERLLAKHPGDEAAYRLRALALADSGASHRAWELYRARPDIFDPAAGFRLEADRVARLIVWGGLRPRSPESRLDEMRFARRELQALLSRLPESEAATAERLRNDDLIALNALGEHAQVVAAHEARGQALPTYTGTAVGDSLLAMRRPRMAAAALEQTLSEDPGSHHARILLVYAYVESERFDDAQRLLEAMRGSQAPWLWQAGAREPYANWRRYDADVTGILVASFAHALDQAQADAEALVSVGALNAELHQTLGAVYLQRGWAERGLQRQRVAATLAPADSGPLVGQAQALLDLDRTPEAAALLDGLLRSHPGDVHAQRNAQRLQRRRGWQVTHGSAWGRNTADAPDTWPAGSPLGTREARHLLRVASPLYADRWRITAHAAHDHADFRGERIHRKRVGLGVDYALDRLRWNLEASAPLDHHDRQASLGAQAGWRFSDVLTARAAVRANDPAASLQARRVGITADSATLGVSWRRDESGSLSATLQQFRYDDGNHRESVSVAFAQRLLARPHFLFDAFGGVHASRGSREDAPYFNPPRDASLELGLRADRIVWRHYQRHFRHRLAVSAAHYRQHGFSAEWYPVLAYEHEWQLAPGRQLSYAINYSRPVYDGLREERVGFEMQVRWGE